MAKKDLINSLQYIIDTIEDALDKGADNAAFICALSIPDICSQIEFSRKYIKDHSNGESYARWYNENFYLYENPSETKINQLDGDIMFDLRCKMFHEGSIDHKNIRKKLKKKYTDKFKEEFRQESPKGVILKFKINMNANRESVVFGYSEDSITPKVINVDVNVNQSELAKRITWTAKGVISDFKKNNHTSI